MFSKIRHLIKDGFFHILIGNTLIKTVGFISGIILVNLLDKNNYAYLAYSDNLYAYIIAFSGLGLSTAILKYSRIDNPTEINRAYYEYALKIGSFVQLVLVLGLLIYANLFEIPFAESKNVINAMLLIPIITYVVEVSQAYIRTMKNNRLYAIIGFSQVVIILVFTIILIPQFGLFGNIASRYFAFFISFIVLAITISKKYSTKNKYILSTNQKKEFVTMGVSMVIASLFSIIIPMNEMLLVNNILQDEVITSNYKVSFLIPSQIVFLTNSIMIYFFVVIANQKKSLKIFTLSKKIGLFNFFMIFIIILTGFILTPQLISLIYGDNYLEIVPTFRLFWLVFGSNAIIRIIPMNILAAIGKAKINAYVSIISSVFHFIITYILIYYYGISGVGYGTLIVFIMSGIFFWIYLHRYLREKEQESL